MVNGKRVPKAGDRVCLAVPFPRGGVSPARYGTVVGRSTGRSRTLRVRWDPVGPVGTVSESWLADSSWYWDKGHLTLAAPEGANRRVAAGSQPDPGRSLTTTGERFAAIGEKLPPTEPVARRRRVPDLVIPDVGRKMPPAEHAAGPHHTEKPLGDVEEDWVMALRSALHVDPAFPPVPVRPVGSGAPVRSSRR